MRDERDTAITRAAAIARRQHGVVSRPQLLGTGISAAAIGRWVAKGLLHPEFRGVYRLGHRAPSVLARYAASVLAGGEGAVLGGFAAAKLLELLRGRRTPLPEILVPSHRRLRQGLVVRRAQLHPSEVARVRGIPCTTPARTVADLAGRLAPGDLATLHHEADVRCGLRADDVLAILGRRPNLPGAVALRRVVLGDTPAELSRLERAFRRLIRERGYPRPEINRPQGAHYVDFRWPVQRLSVELNGYRFHRTRRAWEQDMHRERAARARGDRFRRFTWYDVAEDQTHLLASLDALLPRR